MGWRSAPRTLPSERDQNFLLLAAAGERFVLKIANAAEERGMLETQNRVMRHLGEKLPFCPRVLAALNGEFIGEAVSAGSTAFCAPAFLSAGEAAGDNPPA